jgi:hypothetical protein
MEPGIKMSRSSCTLETRAQPEKSTGNPLDWKSRSKLSDVLLGYKESKIGPCGGVNHQQNEKKKTAHRGASNAEAPAPPLLKELTGPYRVSLGTSARKEGAVAVVGD